MRRKTLGADLKSGGDSVRGASNVEAGVPKVGGYSLKNPENIK